MNKFLKILLFSNSITVVSDNLLIPLFALFVNKITTGVELVGILFAIQYISSTVFGLFVIRIRDRHNLDNYLLKINYILKGSSWALLIFSQTVTALVTVEIIQGLATAIGAPAFNSLISEHLDSNRHIKDWTVWELSFGTATAIGSILSGILLSNFGFSVIFGVMAALEFASLGVYHFSQK